MAVTVGNVDGTVIKFRYLPQSIKWIPRF